ncbi:MAG TPA: response regulator [Opitutaceae bacterium]|nr:response regulator [Opitutaceae bacterium]
MYLPPPSSPGALPRILLIDDEAESYDLFARVLIRAGIHNQVDHAAGGEEGIRYLDKCQLGHYAWPCVVFLDIRMPVMNGFDVLTWMRARGMLGKVVVVMLSSSTEPTDVGRAFGLGVHHYISKEAGAEIVASLVRTAMTFAPLKAKSRLSAVATNQTAKGL